MQDKPVDFFFKIILEDHFPELQESFDYPIKRNQKELINTLANFIRIKYNFKDVAIKELNTIFKSLLAIKSINFFYKIKKIFISILIQF